MFKLIDREIIKVLCLKGLVVLYAHLCVKYQISHLPAQIVINVALVTVILFSSNFCRCHIEEIHSLLSDRSVN